MSNKITRYRYLGDKLTCPEFKNRECFAVRNEKGKCIRGKNSNMLVELSETGDRLVVLARLLRKTKDL